MTADSREGDKTHSESSVTQNCSFQGLIVFKNTLCNEEGALLLVPFFFHIISSALNTLGAEANNALNGRHLHNN